MVIRDGDLTAFGLESQGPPGDKSDEPDNDPEPRWAACAEGEYRLKEVDPDAFYESLSS